ncbi:leucyl aminopeptidase [Candidatus Peregrinibacteria bacterium]|nr:leucyl aminopeptidase [Candidatus Peregrinibacteria bacterium]
MKISLQQRLKSKDGVLVVPLFENQLKDLSQNLPAKIREFIGKVHKNKAFKGAKNEMLLTYFGDKGLPPRLLLLGLGKSPALSVKSILNCAGMLGKKLKSGKIAELNILLPQELYVGLEHFLIALIQSQYDTGKLKKINKSKHPHDLQKVNFIIDKISRVSEKELEAKIEKAQYIGSSLEFVKDLVNRPSNYVHGESMAQNAYKIAKENYYKIGVFGNKELKKMGFGGLLAVNQGAHNEAKCIVLQYHGAPKKNEPPIALIGKGIIFDTGGYNMKMNKKMDEMHQDMAGGATVLGIFRILKDLEIKKNVIGIIPIAENLVSDKAYRPSDIITMLSGHTVEITNTDAEGRIVLADAITYALEFKPQALITIATLTGAAGIAVGNRYAGLLGNDPILRNKIKNAGKETDDRGWSLPLPKDYIEKMKSKVADLRNYDVGSSHYAGASKGAAFLSYFVGKTPWCHIDIGGTAFTEDPKPYQTHGATGHGFLMLLKFLEQT